MAGRILVPRALPAAEGESAQRLWSGRTLLFMRVMACLEILKGIVHWCQLLGILEVAGTSFEDASALRQATVVFFAVLDPVSAVGLWMGAPWGAVIWLFTAASQITILFILPSFPAAGWFILPYEIIVIGIYVLLTYQAALVKQPLR
jgi:hypothetical protein